jgi:hypothetical protein
MIFYYSQPPSPNTDTHIHVCMCVDVMMQLFCGMLNIFLFQNLLTDAFVLQVCRSIGDVYLKKAEFNREPLYAKFRLREPFKRPILSSEPSISVNELQPHDQFLIFASDGLWEHLSNQEAVDIVQNHPHSVSYSFRQSWFLSYSVCVFTYIL